MAKDLASQTLAFAAICQASAIIQQLARFGTWDDNSAKVLIKSLSVDNPRTAEDVFPSKNLGLGYKTLVESFGSKSDLNDQNMEIAKYVMLIIGLERKLNNIPGLFSRIFNKIDETKAYARENQMLILDDRVIERLADAYFTEVTQKRVTNFMICGKKTFLQQDHIQMKIRAILLSAVRAVILWRQSGGRRLTLFFKRSKMVDFASVILKRN